MAFHVFYVILLLCISASSYADDTAEDDSEPLDRHSLPVMNLPVGLRTVTEDLPANVMYFLASAGAIILAVLVIGAILSLILPLFGIKLCYLLGTCEHVTYFSQPLGAVGTQYDAYANGATFNNPVPSTAYSSSAYQKRSLEYVGPILKALSAAYEKYAVPLVKKKE
ncbi:uncharacterized protein LOC124623558 isoform X1 [Schistocerca americana]|uniref:uncharacterized protein LOC124623558 isoform X1 n=1 Tax=Schistocerca americana TaxID=7009 RepID=UPI001F501F20|nr:uncharacterized protein LOC124623558 isoform X1 [Schistocerca americana]XP_049950176.1 uncharacterized protein LOC126457691 isoform X1 [Schistocerca serialis cubense]